MISARQFSIACISSRIRNKRRRRRVRRRRAGVFLPINTAPGGNPYEFDTGNLLVCPTVSSHA